MVAWPAGQSDLKKGLLSYCVELRSFRRGCMALLFFSLWCLLRSDFKRLGSRRIWLQLFCRIAKHFCLLFCWFHFAAEYFTKSSSKSDWPRGVFARYFFKFQCFCSEGDTPGPPRGCKRECQEDKNQDFQKKTSFILWPLWGAFREPFWQPSVDFS